jgi:hypothetical protein
MKTRENPLESGLYKAARQFTIRRTSKEHLRSGVLEGVQKLGIETLWTPEETTHERLGMTSKDEYWGARQRAIMWATETLAAVQVSCAHEWSVWYHSLLGQEIVIRSCRKCGKLDYGLAPFVANRGPGAEGLV